MKRVLIVITLLIVLISCGVVFADCNEDQLIMRLSSETNAHAQNATIGTYLTSICYNDIFGVDYSKENPRVCDGMNNILSLSGETNAHASFAADETYTIPICFGDLNSCEYLESGDCPEKKTCIVKISGETNAHLSTCDSVDDYGKVCCARGGDVEPEAYWTNNAGTRIEDGAEVNIVANNTKLKLVLITGDESLANQEVNLTIISTEWVDEDVDLVFTTTANENGNVVYDWIPTQEEYDLIAEYETWDPPLNLQFQDNLIVQESSVIDVSLVDLLQQDECVLNSIDFCSSYTTPEECSTDVCDVADTSSNVVCGQTNTFLSTEGTLIWNDCSCEWNETENACKPTHDVYSDEGTGDELMGTCTETQITDDDCSDDGFLTYTWTGDWTWADGVTPDIANEDYQNCINDVGDEVTVSCPSYTRLTFVSLQNLAIAVVIIFIIYLILKFVKKNPAKNKKKTKKK